MRHGSHGSLLLDDRVLRSNLSYVLHDHSQSVAVAEIAKQCKRHAHRVQAIRPSSITVLTSEDGWCDRYAFPNRPSIWLTATIGLPHVLNRIVSTSLLFCDRHEWTSTSNVFFRAPARIAVPLHSEESVMVGAVLLRPDRKSAHFHREGPFNWVNQRAEAICALERLIQIYVDQWMPKYGLWDEPIEAVLNDEIIKPHYG